MRLLRGEAPNSPALLDTIIEEKRPHEQDRHSGRERKRRKRWGESDTDFEMRLASEQTRDSNSEKQLCLSKDTDAPITDHSGNISLFPAPVSKKPHSTEKNAEAEKEAARKKREYEDQYTMRFSNAAGLKQSLGDPWYSRGSTGKPEVTKGDLEMPSKDVWGNEDPRRKDREAERMVQNDPLVVMKQGAAQVRQVERERRQWREEKQRETKELKEAESRGRRHKRRLHEDGDSLEDFRLDDEDRGSISSQRRKTDNIERERRHQHKHSDRDRHREQDERHKHKHKHRHRQSSGH